MIRIICVGKIKEQYLVNMIEDYYSAGLDGLDNALGIWKLDRPGGFH